MAKQYLISFCNTDEWLRLAVVNPHRIERVIEIAYPVSLRTNGITGICVHQDKVYIALQSRPNSMILELDRNLEPVREIMLNGISDIHGIIVHNDELAVVSTGTNEIFAIDPNRTGEPRLLWSDAGTSADRDHLNDLQIGADGKLIVSRFGSRAVEHIRSGSIIEVDSGQVLLDGLREPHSPFWWNQRLYVLESTTGDLVCARRGEFPARVLGILGYARGLFIDEDFVVIGKSGYRSRSRSLLGDDRAMPLCPTDDVGAFLQLSGVYFIPHDGAAATWVDTTRWGYEIYQIRALPDA